ncbi:hypothetical protein [Frigoribacterium sp. Leaf44]|uniref:hypothetical protein n=1 Tax=Frigoribacterium sp. Leaf44 TaxID=1736220 RepID=UPI000AF7AD0D|nr:hypothetical protein [Frigoribacterium sp. Leaf44]
MVVAHRASSVPGQEARVASSTRGAAPPGLVQSLVVSSLDLVVSSPGARRVTGR